MKRLFVLAATVGATLAAAAPASAITCGSCTTYALWHMNETSGTTMHDATTNNHDGTLHGGITLGVGGDFGTAFQMGGTNSNITVPSDNQLQPGSASYFEVNGYVDTTHTPPAPPNDFDIVRKGDFTTGGAEWKMEMESNGTINCGFEGTSNYAEVQSTSSINVHDGHWHQVACVDTGGPIPQIIAEVDGVDTVKDVTIGTVSNTDQVVFGAHSTSGGDEYIGKLDEFSIQKP